MLRKVKNRKSVTFRKISEQDTENKGRGPRRGNLGGRRKIDYFPITHHTP